MIDPLELHAYADGQLSNADRDRILRDLETDAVARAELDSIIALKAFVGRNAQPVECHDEWKACVGRLNELDKSRRTENFIGRYAWGLCGVFFLAIVMGGVMSRTGGSSSAQSADLARVVASLSPVSSPAPKEPAAMRRWLDELVGQAAASISPDRFDVVRSSTGEVDGHRAASIVIRDATGDMSLLMVNGMLSLDNLPLSPDGQFRTCELQGAHCIAWHDRGNTLVLSGSRSYDDLVKVAQTRLVR